MAIPTNTEIFALLDQLNVSVADDLETQWLDFKPWQNPKAAMNVAIEYTVCFANSDGGVIVFGIADRTRGRAAAIHGASGYKLDLWRRNIFDATRPNVTVEVEELAVPEGSSFDERMAALVAKWREQGRDVDLDGLLVMSYLREHAFIDTSSASELLQLSRDTTRGVLDHLAQPRTGILERRGKTRAATYHLNKAVAKDLLGKTAYTKTKGVDPIRYREMVKAFVADHGSITPRECRELLGLGESQTARVEVSRSLREWSGADGFLRREGTRGPNVRYFPRTEDAKEG